MNTNTKISLNVSANTIKWLERFKDTSCEEPYHLLSRTEIIQGDLFHYADLLTEGVVSLAKKITADEFFCLTGAFNEWLPMSQVTSGGIKFRVQEYDAYSYELSMNCESLGIDKEQLLETVSGLNPAECHALLDYARRCWSRNNMPNNDKLLEDIGLDKVMFKQAS